MALVATTTIIPMFLLEILLKWVAMILVLVEVKKNSKNVVGNKF